MKLSLEATCNSLYRNRNNMDASMLTNEYGQVINKTSEQTQEKIRKIYSTIAEFCLKITFNFN